MINGEVAATLPVPRDQAGTLVARDVSIDPRFITEFNHLNVQLIGHYTQQCEDPSSSSLWATVSNASSLDLTYAFLASKPDLAALPQPFFDRRDVRRLELPFVFAQKPSAQTLEAAGAVASWFGSLAGYRGAVFPAQIDNAPLAGNAVIFATSDARPAGVNIPPVSGPTIAVVDREAPARGRFLLVLGRNDAELKTAARALGMGQNTLSGNSATITQLTDLQPRRPYDAPNWLPTDRPVRFGELAEARDLTVSGYDADAVRVNLRVPPDLFMWQTKGVPIDLAYRYTVRPAPGSLVAEHQRQQWLRAVAADSGGVVVHVRSRPVLQPRDARPDRRRAPRDLPAAAPAHAARAVAPALLLRHPEDRRMHGARARQRRRRDRSEFDHRRIRLPALHGAARPGRVRQRRLPVHAPGRPVADGRDPAERRRLRRLQPVPAGDGPHGCIDGLSGDGRDGRVLPTRSTSSRTRTC